MKTIQILIFIIFPYLLFSQSNKDIDETLVRENISIKLNMMKKLADDEPNYLLTIYRNKKPILEDKIFSKIGEIDIVDFNDDGVKDILVQNISDVRGNWTYYLYLYDKKKKDFRKVKDFETIKNPQYNSQYKIIESYVVSGKNYINFYRIKNHKIEDLNLSITDDNSINYELEYKKVLPTLKKMNIK